MRLLLAFSLCCASCAAEDVQLGTKTNDAGVADTSTPDTTPPATRDAAVDTSLDTPIDAPVDAPIDASEVSATISAEYLFQSCMPIVASDPVQLKATIALSNPTALDLGTLRASKGRFVSGTGSVTVATFEFPEVTTSLPAMGTGTATFEKTRGSAEPKSGCGTLPCGASVRVEVTLTGPTVTITARSGEISVECAY